MEHVSGENDFNEKMKSAPVVVFDFTAVWCGPCKMLTPILEEMSKTLDPSRVKIFKVDVDENGHIANKFGISAVPTVVFAKNGKIQDDFLIGVRSRKEYETKIEKLLA